MPGPSPGMTKGIGAGRLEARVRVRGAAGQRAPSATGRTPSPGRLCRLDLSLRERCGAALYRRPNPLYASGIQEGHPHAGDERPRPDRQHAARRDQALRHRPCRLFLKLESAEPRRLDQGPHRAVDDRGRRARRPAAAGRHDRRGDRRQHRPRPGPGRHRARATALVLVVPDKMSREKILHLRGARRRGAHHPLRRRQGPPRLLPGHGRRRSPRETPGAFYVNQFANPANPLAHETTTGPEIWEQMGHDVDAVVVGVGSGGTLTGLGALLRAASRRRPRWCSPIRSARCWRRYVKTGKMGEAGSLGGRGHRRGFRAAELPTCRWSAKAYSISDRGELRRRARAAARRKASSPARRPARCLPRRCAIAASRQTPKRVVTFVCDSGNKYLSKVFNDFWMAEQGLARTRPRIGDLRDLVARRYERGRRDHVGAGRHAAHRLSRACAPPTSRSCRCSTAAGWSASSTRATCSRAVDGRRGHGERVPRAGRRGHDRASSHTSAGRRSRSTRSLPMFEPRRGGDRHRRRRVPRARSPAST